LGDRGCTGAATSGAGPRTRLSALASDSITCTQCGASNLCSLPSLRLNLRYNYPQGLRTLGSVRIPSHLSPCISLGTYLAGDWQTLKPLGSPYRIFLFHSQGTKTLAPLFENASYAAVSGCYGRGFIDGRGAGTGRPAQMKAVVNLKMATSTAIGWAAQQRCFLMTGAVDKICGIH
jgi:hypothetical protein